MVVQKQSKGKCKTKKKTNKQTNKLKTQEDRNRQKERRRSRLLNKTTYLCVLIKIPIRKKEQFTTMSQILKGTSKSKLPKRTDKKLVLAPMAPLLRLNTLKNLKRYFSAVTPPEEPRSRWYQYHSRCI